MSASRKKVILRKFGRDWLSGYLPAGGFLHGGNVDLLDLAGKITSLRLDDVKWICYVRDFNSGEPGNPERLLRRSFTGRPRGEGLWLRLRLRDNDVLEGLAQNDLSLLDSEGLYLIPPDTRSNTQRVFLPRNAVSQLEVVSVIRPVTHRRGPKEAEPGAVQEDLFNAQGSLS